MGHFKHFKMGIYCTAQTPWYKEFMQVFVDFFRRHGVEIAGGITTVTPDLSEEDEDCIREKGSCSHWQYPTCWRTFPLPIPVIDLIRRAFAVKDIYINGRNVSLFLYDNNTFVLYCYAGKDSLPETVTIHLLREASCIGSLDSEGQIALFAGKAGARHSLVISAVSYFPFGICEIYYTLSMHKSIFVINNI